MVVEVDCADTAGWADADTGGWKGTVAEEAETVTVTVTVAGGGWAGA